MFEAFALPEAPSLSFGTHLDETAVREWAGRVRVYAEQLQAQVEAALDPYHIAHADALNRLPALQEKVESLQSEFSVQAQKLNRIQGGVADQEGVNRLEEIITGLQDLLEIEAASVDLGIDTDIETRAVQVCTLIRRFQKLKPKFQTSTMSSSLTGSTSPLTDSTTTVPHRRSFLHHLESSLTAFRGGVLSDALTVINSNLEISSDSLTLGRSFELVKTWKSLEILGAVNIAVAQIAKSLTPLLSSIFLEFSSDIKKIDVLLTNESGSGNSNLRSHTTSMAISTPDIQVDASEPANKLTFTFIRVLNHPKPHNPKLDTIAESLVLCLEFIGSWLPSREEISRNEDEDEQTGDSLPWASWIPREEKKFPCPKLLIGKYLWTNFLVPGFLSRKFQLDPKLSEKIEKQILSFRLLPGNLSGNLSGNFSGLLSNIAADESQKFRANSLGALRDVLTDPKIRGQSVRLTEPGNSNFKFPHVFERLGPKGVAVEAISEATFRGLSWLETEKKFPGPSLTMLVTLIASVRKAQTWKFAGNFSPESFRSFALLVNDLIFLSSWVAASIPTQKPGNSWKSEPIGERLKLVLSLREQAVSESRKFLEDASANLKSQIKENLEIRGNFSIKSIFDSLSPILSTSHLSFWLDQLLFPGLEYLRDEALNRPNEQTIFKYGEEISRDISMEIPGLGILFSDLKIIWTVGNCSRAEIMKLPKVEISSILEKSINPLLRGNPKIQSAIPIDASLVLKILKGL